MSYSQRVRDFVVANFLFGDGGSLEDDTLFMGGSIIDSTGILELVEFLEATYSIEIANEEMVPENLDSVSRVAQFVTRKVSQTASVPVPSSGGQESAVSRPQRPAGSLQTP